MNAFQELDSLQQTLNDALNTFREELKAANLPPLSLVSAERHPLDDYSYLASPRLYEARRVAIASMGQLKSLIQNPFEKAYEGALSAYSRAALEVMVETGLSDYLGSVADSAKGAPVPDIQKALDMDSRRLIMVLRLLATDGWVRETSEGVFALNRPGLELLSDRQGYNVMRVAAVGLFANQLVGWLQHPQWKYSDAVNETPVQMAYKTRLPLFQWLNEHPEAFARMTKGIKASGSVSLGPILSDYPWDELKEKTIIDCGGGLGFLPIQLAKKFPSLRFIVQDLSEVVALTRTQIDNDLPDLSDAGRIATEVQDFFAPRTRTGNDYHFLFKYVLHDWADDRAIDILKGVAAAAGPESKVLIIETVTTPGIVAGPDAADAAASFAALDAHTYHEIPPPPFIPANFGAAAYGRESLRLHLLSLMNAQARTLSQWTNLVRSAGLEVKRVLPLRADVSIMECGLPAA